MKTAVIGGGAAGITAAISARRENPGCFVTVFERNDRILKKIPATGNGRCNLTNVCINTENYFSSSYNSVQKILSCPGETETFFESIGIMLCEENGRIYPYSRRATAVSDALRFEADRLGVKIICNTFVKEIKPLKNGFSVMGEFFDSVILASGGSSAPTFGTDGNGLRLIEKLGLKYIPFSPALVPLSVNENVKSLKGIRTHCSVSAYNNGKLMKSETGEVQFTDYGLSGVVVMQLSRLCKKNTEIYIDLIPDMTEDALSAYIKKRKNLLSYRQCEDFLTGMLHKSLTVYILRQCDISPSSPVSSVDEKKLLLLCRILKKLKFTVKATLGFKESQASAGGALLDEFYPDTLESKKLHNFYCIGELLDCVGDCGGYNLHWAWTTAIRAGRACAEKMG